MPRFKLTLAFDGSAYHGWQSQKSGRSVQDQVEAALARVFPSAPKIQGSSRTDAGVHALGMVIHFDVPQEELRMPVRHLALSINALLPEDIQVMKAVRAKPGFNARFDAKGKQYRYHVWNDAAMNPLLRGQAWHVPRPLDLAAMRDAAASLPGTHDFRSFTANRGAVLEDAVRTLTRCEIRRSGKQLTFIMEGGGFLHKMCRGIVGTLVQIGEGKYPSTEITRMLEQRDRRTAGMNAPAHGLVLAKVLY